MIPGLFPLFEANTNGDEASLQLLNITVAAANDDDDDDDKLCTLKKM